jgi:hypothetical protein
MASPTEIGGDVVAAAGAVAGLMLVYMGGLSTGYGAFQPQEKKSVRASYRQRMWFAFVGLVLNSAAIPFGLAAKALDSACLLWAALALLLFGIVWLVLAAVFTALEID